MANAVKFGVLLDVHTTIGCMVPVKAKLLTLSLLIIADLMSHQGRVNVVGRLDLTPIANAAG